MPEEAVIRQYRKQDRDFIRKIVWDTALIGEPADKIFSDKEVLEDFLTQYFTDFEPESCFVAEVKDKVVGYLLGAKNASVLERVFNARIFPFLLFKALFKGALFRKKNVSLLSNIALSFLKGEFKIPDLSRCYPATLHINLERGFRDSGIGSKLMSSYLDYLAKKQIPGVYLATMSDKAAGFFKKQGFRLLFQGKRSYFKFVLRKEVPLYIFAKRLP